MKTLSTLAVVVALGLSSVMTGAAYASVTTEPNSTFNFVPPACSSKAFKAAHPTWYRIGGFCNPYDADSHTN
jgi:hypothetical protein